MKQCTYCGAELQDDARACNNCGRPVPGMEEPEQDNLKKTVDTAATEEPSVPAKEGWQESWGQPGQSQDPWQQDQPQSPWGQPGQLQDPWQQNQSQNPWGQPGQPQDPWQQNQPQSPWGQPGQSQDPWRQNQPQNPWGQPGGQNAWDSQRPQQTPWGWPQNESARQGYGQYPGNGSQTNVPARYNMFALWALVFGFLASFLNGLVFIPSIIAIVFAIVGLVQIRRNPGLFRGKWMAFVGLAFGVFFMIVYGYVFHMVFQAVQNPETFEQLQEYLREINAIR